MKHLLPIILSLPVLAGLPANAANCLSGRGSNLFGQLGEHHEDADRGASFLATNVKSVAVGENHTLYVTDDGALWAMGENSVGQLGDGTDTPSNVPIHIADGVERVAAGLYFSLYLTADGELWGMGQNSDGQLGTGTLENVFSPVKIAEDVKHMAAGGWHSLFVKTDNSLWGMGSNFSRQLKSDLGDQITSPVQIASDVLEAEAGDRFSLWITLDKTLQGIGENSAGQLGDTGSSPVNTPVTIATDVTAAAAGSDHTLYIRSDLSLHGLGLNSEGQLGSEAFSYALKPVQIATQVTAIDAGGESSVFQINNKWLWAIGYNNRGQLHSSTEYSLTSPHGVSDDVETFALGPRHMVYTSTIGELTVTASGAKTGENGAAQEISFQMNRYPRDVTVAIETSDPTEGFPEVTEVLLTVENYNQPHTVSIRGIDDAEDDGAVAYHITLSDHRTDPTLCPAFLPVTLSFTNEDDDFRPLPQVSTLTIITNLPAEATGQFRVTDVSSDGSAMAGWAMRRAEAYGNFYDVQTPWLWNAAAGLRLAEPITLDNTLRNVNQGPQLSPNGSYLVCLLSSNFDIYDKIAGKWSPGSGAEKIDFTPYLWRLTASPNLEWFVGVRGSKTSRIFPFSKEANGRRRSLGPYHSVPNAVANDGTTAARINYSPDFLRSDSGIWRPSFNDLKLVPIDPDESHAESWPTVISDDGKVIAGFRQFADGTGYSYRWTEAGGMKSIGAEEGSPNPSSISADGSIIVGDWGWIWTEWGGLQMLNDYLQNEHGIELRGIWDDVHLSADGMSMGGMISLTNTAGPNAGIWLPWFATLADPRRDRIAVSELAGQVTETGGQATFTVRLHSAPAAAVEIPLDISELDEALVSPNPVLIPAGEVGPVTVTITGQDDALVDGAQPVAIRLLKSVSADARFSGIDAPDIFLTNLDNESPLDMAWEPPRYIPLGDLLPRGFYLSTAVVEGEFSYSMPTGTPLSELGIHEVRMVFTPTDAAWLPVEKTTEIVVLQPVNTEMPAPSIKLAPSRESLTLEFSTPQRSVLIIDKSTDLGSWSRVHEEVVDVHTEFTDEQIEQSSQGYYRYEWLQLRE